MDSLEAKRLYTTEGLFYEAGVEYWLPVQANLLSSMQAEAKAGHVIILYLTIMGAYPSDDQMTWVVPVNEYLVPKEHSKLSWQVKIFCPTTNASAQIAFDTARKLDLQKKTLEAEKLYRQAIELDPHYCDAMNNLGYLLRQQGRIDETIEWYQKSLKVKPDNALVLNNLGIVYKSQNNWNEAIRVFEKLVRVAPDDPEGYYSLGRAFFDLGQFTDAASNLESAEILYYQNGSPYILDADYYLGVSFFLLGDYARSRGYLAPVYSYRVDDAQINLCLGFSYLNTEPQELELVKKYLLKAESLGYKLPESWVEDLVQAFGAWPPG
jgi:tetratricopeptide (TPR) repeat protein